MIFPNVILIIEALSEKEERNYFNIKQNHRIFLKNQILEDVFVYYLLYVNNIILKLSFFHDSSKLPLPKMLSTLFISLKHFVIFQGLQQLKQN